MIDHEAPKAPPRWQILRLEPNHETEVTLLSTAWLQVGTHFSGRTFLCCGDGVCPACDQLTKRNLWYLPILVAKKPMLLELSAWAAADLEQHSRMYWGRFSSGQRLAAVRSGKRSPIRFAPIDFDKLEREPAPQVWISAVMGIYGFPPMEDGENAIAYRQRLTPMALAKVRRVMDHIAAGVQGHRD